MVKDRAAHRSADRKATEEVTQVELQALATAVRDSGLRGSLVDEMSPDESRAFEVYVGEYEASDVELKKDKVV